MARPLKLEHLFEQARRRPADPLPADFTASVMAQLAATCDRASRIPGFWPTAAAAVLTAAAIGLLASPRPATSPPPKLAMFGGTAHSPFSHP
jgi:hypothetical protein